MATPKPTPIYHVTHCARNLASILQEDGLLSFHEMKRRGISYQNISYDHIQDRRERTMVFGTGYCLHDYVPFHFAPRSPMLYTIHRGNVPAYAEGQASLIYLESTAQAATNAGFQCAFTDGHPTMAITEFFSDLVQLDRVSWPVMCSHMWNDTQQQPDRKRRRQAEFLVYKQFPINLISKIVVINARVQAEVLEILSGFDVVLPVQIKPEWYY